MARAFRLALNTVLAVSVVAFAVVLGSWVHDLHVPSGLADPQAAAAPSATSAAGAAVGNCDALARVLPDPAPTLSISDVGSGKTQVTSAEGGYSIVVPASWLVTPGYFTQPAFGQAHITSYDPKSLPTPGPEAPGILPPKYGIRLDIEIWDNSARKPLDVYASTVRIGPDQSSIDPGAIVDVDGRSAYHFVIRDEHRFSPAPGQLITTKQTRHVWLILSPRVDRLIVLYATPVESALFTQVESAVAAMKVTTPIASRMPVTRQRTEVVDRWLVDAKGSPVAGRRVEAKLAAYREAMEAASGYLGLARMDRDWDELFWVVAVSGPDLPQSRGGPFRQAESGPPSTIPPTTWMVLTTPATNDNGAGTSGATATTGTWPPRFDDLVDRCR